MADISVAYCSSHAPMMAAARESATKEQQRSFLGALDQVLDMPDEELELAGHGAHEIRSWLAIAGAVAPSPGRLMSGED